MRFLVDAQLPPALVRFLKAASHDADHVEDVGHRNADDDPIWEFATSRGAVLLTKDEDFAQRRLLTVEGPPSSGCLWATARTEHYFNGSRRCFRMSLTDFNRVRN